MAETDLDYAKVTGRFGLTVADGPDAGDNPDIVWCDEGTIKITPLITYTKVMGASPVPWTAGHSVISATIDSQGYLTHNAQRFVWVVDLTSTKVNPHIPEDQATHQIEFENVKAAGTRVSFPSVPVRITAADGDITSLAPLLPGPAEPIYQGEPGVGVESATVDDGNLLIGLTDGSILDAGPIPGTDDDVAGYVSGTGPTKTAVSNAIANEAAAAVPTATTTAQGKVELATTSETTTGTDTARAVTPAGLKAVTDGLTSTLASAITEATGYPTTPDALWAARFPATLPAEDAVTITVISEADYQATPSLGVSGGTLIAPARLGAAPTDGLDFLGDTHFRYSGGPSGKGIDAAFVGPANDVAGASMLLHPEFVTTRGITRHMLKVKSTSTTLAFRLSVGEFWERDELRRVTVAANSIYYIVVEAATARSRRIKLELASGTYFGGVVVPTGQSVNRAPDRPLYIALGDSFNAGTGVPPDAANRLETSPNYEAQAFGHDLTNLSISGTGWDQGDPNSYGLRIPAALAMNPSVIHIAGSPNDISDANPNDDDVADTYHDASAALAQVTDVPYVFVSGPTQTPAGYLALSNAVRDAAVENGIRFGEMTGTLTSADIGSDGLHPTFAGQKTRAKSILARIGIGALRTAVASISKALPTVTLAASPATAQALGSPVTLTAIIGGGYAGAAEFRAGPLYLGRTRPAGGTAALAVSSLALGNYAMTARFVPDNQLRVRNVTSAPVLYSITPVTLTDIILDNLLVEATIAQLTALANGDAIASLTPTRGSKLDALPQTTAGSRMIYTSPGNSPDGKAFMKQTGAQGLAAPVWSSALAAGTPRTLFVPFKSVSPPSANTAYLLNRGASTAGDRLQIGTGGVGALTVSSTAVVAPPNQVARAGWQVWALRFDGAGQCTAFQNRPTGDLFNISNSTVALAGIGIGGGSSPGTVETHHRGGYAYSGGMSDDNIRAMLVYLANLHGAALDA